MRWTEFAAKEARQTLAAWEARVGAIQLPIAVEDLADLLYLLAIDTTSDLPSTLAGRLYAEQRIIEVRRSDHSQRQRFTIAHEIGHYRLHVIAEGIQQKYDCTTESVRVLDSAEDQAYNLPLPEFTFQKGISNSKSSDLDLRRREIEANTFAAELLMPAHLVEAAVHRDGVDINHLANLFDVSRQAMRYRLEKLLFLPTPNAQMNFFTDL